MHGSFLPQDRRPVPAGCCMVRGPCLRHMKQHKEKRGARKEGNEKKEDSTKRKMCMLCLSVALFFLCLVFLDIGYLSHSATDHMHGQHAPPPPPPPPNKTDHISGVAVGAIVGAFLSFAWQWCHLAWPQVQHRCMSSRVATEERRPPSLLAY